MEKRGKEMREWHSLRPMEFAFVVREREKRGKDGEIERKGYKEIERVIE